MLEITKDYLTARALTRLHNIRYQGADARINERLAARLYANGDRSTWRELTRAKDFMDGRPDIYHPDTAIREFEYTETHKAAIAVRESEFLAALTAS